MESPWGWLPGNLSSTRLYVMIRLCAERLSNRMHLEQSDERGNGNRRRHMQSLVSMAPLERHVW